MTGISLKIGARELIPATEEDLDRKLTVLLWGQSGHGKTQFAETMPGDKLWLMFDPGGEDAIRVNSPRGHNHFIPLYKEKEDIVLQFKNVDPLGIEKMLVEHPEIETIIFDSLTTFSEMALGWGVVAARSTAKGKTATIEDPGYAGYGHKKVFVMEAFKNMLRLAKRTNRHILFTAHEDRPDTNEKGEFIGISLMLGSSLIVEVPVRVSEVLHLTDVGGKRRVAIRPSRGRSPMRTRLFFSEKDPEFDLTYNATTNTGDGFAEFYELWKWNKFQKIPLPGTPDYLTMTKRIK